MRAKQPVIIYTRRGRVERGSRYKWHEAYSATTPEGYVLYPWMTRRECRADAKTKGARAVFEEPA